MTRGLILLTANAFAADIQARLSLGGRVPVSVVTTLPELRAAAPGRLVCAGTGVIVPPDALNALLAPAYNFHPGPPEYRGLFPSVFALYDGAAEFGVTCHEMTDEIDSGAIVGVSRFPTSANREQLDARTYIELLKLVEELAPRLADVSQPLAHLSEKWSGPVRRRADFESLCRLPADVSATEFKRRYDAVGEGPNHALSYELHGRTFKLAARTDAPIVRGGKPA